MLIAVNVDLSLIIYAQFVQNSASEEFMKRYEDIHNGLQIRWLQKGI